MEQIPVEKNEEDELPIPHVWRPIFKSIVKAFVKRDYGLSAGIEYVNPVSNDTMEQIKDYIDDYGEELIDLPEETWDTSVYICYGDYWSVMVDLFTKDEGLSDLVLNVEVREANGGYSVEIDSVYVP